VDGEDYPVFNAIPVSFESGTGIFTDNFDDGDSDGWTEEGATPWKVESGEYKTDSSAVGFSSNGCDAWQDYEAQVEIKRNGSLGAGDFVGLVLRYQSSTQFYLAQLYCSSNCGGSPGDEVYSMEISNFDGGATGLVSSTFTFDDNEYYTLKVSVVGDDLSAKIWQTSEAEPADWDITVVDTSYTQGKIGITTTTNTTSFDNVAVTPS
jgi:hypothetical protein